MVDYSPASFDPTQYLNRYSQFTNGALPQTSYSGVPVNAGTGVPISSYVPPPPPAPVAPAPAPSYSAPGTTLSSSPVAGGGGAPTNAIQELINNYQTAQAALTPQQRLAQDQATAYRDQMLQQQSMLTAAANQGGGFGRMPGGAFNPGSGYYPMMGQIPQAPAGIMSQPSPASSAASDAYLQALAHPDKVVTPGVPGVSAAYQPGSAGIASVIDRLLAMSTGGQFQPPADPNATGRGTSAITSYAGGNSGFLNALAALRGAPGATPVSGR